jgi:DNA-binding GntR family transcriptional regulator
MKAPNSSSDRLADSSLQQPVADEIADELGRQIVDGRIPIGTWLRQDAVAAQFNVSRQPIREAFRSLQGQGIIVLHPRRGALVQGTSAREIRDACLVRAELEGYAAELAAEHAHETDILALRESINLFRSLIEGYLADEIDESTAAADWREANEKFHRTLLDAAGNNQLRQSIDDLSRRLPRNMTFRAIGRDSRRLHENLEEHIAIADAVERHNAPVAREHARQHLRRAAELISRWYERTVASATAQ